MVFLIQTEVLTKRFGPVTAVWYSELGGLNKFVHIWPYPTLDARNETRKKAQAAGAWRQRRFRGAGRRQSAARNESARAPGCASSAPPDAIWRAVAIIGDEGRAAPLE